MLPFSSKYNLLLSASFSPAISVRTASTVLFRTICSNPLWQKCKRIGFFSATAPVFAFLFCERVLVVRGLLDTESKSVISNKPFIPLHQSFVEMRLFCSFRCCRTSHLFCWPLKRGMLCDSYFLIYLCYSLLSTPGTFQEIISTAPSQHQAQ